MSDPAAQAVKPARPQFRNIGLADISYYGYKMPLAGKLSILHRVSGALLFLGLPAVIAPIFAFSVESQASYDALGQYFYWPVKLIVLALIWAYLHHFCAGIRYLVLDLHIGVDKESAKKSATAVFAVSLALTLVFALKLFGVF
jgi:succinate dehydrogenase / fumarate reductase cytochrome b subunit